MAFLQKENITLTRARRITNMTRLLGVAKVYRALGLGMSGSSVRLPGKAKIKDKNDPQKTGDFNGFGIRIMGSFKKIRRPKPGNISSLFQYCRKPAIPSYMQTIFKG